MICIGRKKEMKQRLESLIEQNFPDRLTLPEILEAANEYESVDYQGN